jgi:hypothetical protein
MAETNLPSHLSYKVSFDLNRNVQILLTPGVYNSGVLHSPHTLPEPGPNETLIELLITSLSLMFTLIFPLLLSLGTSVDARLQQRALTGLQRSNIPGNGFFDPTAGGGAMLTVSSHSIRGDATRRGERNIDRDGII